jgi:hypothetical protein
MRRSPLLVRRGGCAIKKTSRSHLSSRRRGGWLTNHVSTATTPSAPSRRLRCIFFDVASTPPHEGNNILDGPIVLEQGHSPPQPRWGGCAIKKKSRSLQRRRRRGGVGQPGLIYWTSTTPSAPTDVASRYFFDVAATPPRLRRGVGPLYTASWSVKYIDTLTRRGLRLIQTVRQIYSHHL